jgi:hypothetical protein
VTSHPYFYRPKTEESSGRGRKTCLTRARFAEQRYREIMAAFDAQVPAGPDDQRYDMNTIIAEVLAGK